MPTAIDLFDKARNHERLEQLTAAREQDLLPYFRLLEGPAGPEVTMEGRRRIMLGGNNYLGLTGDERVKQAARDALDRYGTGVTGSRFMNGTLPIHLELERELADWMGTEDALVYTAGYLANTGCIATLLGPGDTVICDSGDHASILDAVSMARARVRPYPPRAAGQARGDARARRGRRRRRAGGGGRRVLDGGRRGGRARDRAALPRARRPPDGGRGSRRGRAGRRGTGACELLGAEGDVDLRMGTFSKSLASAAASSPGPADVMDFLRVQSRSFMFTASAVPAAVGAALGALKIIRSDEGPALFQRVLDNARYLHQGLSELGFHVVKPTTLPGGRRDRHAHHPRRDRGRLAGRAVLEGPVRRGRLHERGPLPRRAAGRARCSAAA